MDLNRPVEELSARELRTLNRIRDLQAAAERLSKRLADHPDHRNAEGWKARLLEYRQSLINLRDHGVERPGKGSGITGIEIAVPTFDFAATAHAPGKEI